MVSWAECLGFAFDANATEHQTTGTIGGAGVVGGAIAGGFILGMLESVGLSVLHGYGDITYLVIFVALMVFLSIRPNGLMGKPWG